MLLMCGGVRSNRRNADYTSKWIDFLDACASERVAAYGHRNHRGAWLDF
jgi:hypothetical protein